MTRQFENPANADIHSRTTALDIVDDFSGRRLDYWVNAFGTGGTLLGVSRVLAAERPDSKIMVCEPADAPVLSDGAVQERHADGTPVKPNASWKPHPLQGWSPDFIPKLAGEAVSSGAIHLVIQITGAEAMHWSRITGAEGRHLHRHLGRRVFCWSIEVMRRCACRLHGAMHAGRHWRALPEHAAVRRRGRSEGQPTCWQPAPWQLSPRPS